MNLLFLDIDGVMVSDEVLSDNGMLYPFSDSCVRVLNMILRTNNVRIILTSSWRTVFDTNQQCQIFKENGVIQIPVGQTIDIGYKQRNLEIKRYLENRKVESFIILDDMFIKGFDDNFVLIDPSTGLTEEHIGKINEILNKYEKARN